MDQYLLPEKMESNLVTYTELHTFRYCWVNLNSLVKFKEGPLSQKKLKDKSVAIKKLL